VVAQKNLNFPAKILGNNSNSKIQKFKYFGGKKLGNFL